MFEPESHISESPLTRGVGRNITSQEVRGAVGVTGEEMSLKRKLMATGFAAAMAAGTLVVAAGPASASSLSIVRNGCLDQGGFWVDNGAGEPRRYECWLYYPTYHNIFFYASNGMYVGDVQLSNGGNSGNIHTP